MALDLRGHFRLIEDEFAASLAAPLSARKAMLVAVLLDAFADRFFALFRHLPERVLGAEDVLAYRAQVAKECPALGTVFALCALKPDGPRLAVRTVEVPISEYHKLSVEDYMVSLYNRNTVQRVVVAGVESEPLAHEVLRKAVAWWRGVMG